MIVFIPTPSIIEADDNEVPSTTTDPATNCVHVGKGSEKTTLLAGIFPVFVIVVVYVIVSPIVAKALSPILIVFKIALSIFVVTLLEVIFFETGGFAGLTICWKLTLAWLEIGFIGGISLALI